MRKNSDILSKIELRERSKRGLSEVKESSKCDQLLKLNASFSAFAIFRIRSSFSDSFSTLLSVFPFHTLRCFSLFVEGVSVLLFQRSGNNSNGFGSGWDVILPREWGMSFWKAFIYAGARAIGKFYGDVPTEGIEFSKASKRSITRLTVLP